MTSGSTLCRFAATLFVLFTLTACSGSKGVSSPEPKDAVPLDSSLLVEIKVRPQTLVDAPWEQSVERDVSFARPSVLSGQLPQRRKASWDAGNLACDGSDYDNTLPFNLVSNTSKILDFSPNWVDSSSPLSALAYCTYVFKLDDYGTSGETQSIRLNWEGPGPDTSRCYVGLGNFSTDTWDWFNPDDEVLSIESYAPYTDGSGNTLVCVALLGTAPESLGELIVGAPELRGLGMQQAPPPDQDSALPPLGGSGASLPSSVNLRPSMPNVRSQGSIGSCTAFAARNAYNYELNCLWAPYGWDDTKDENKIGPRWIYNQNNLGCPDNGYYNGSVASWLVANGAATEKSVPYGNGDDDDYDCGTGFGAAAYSDAQHLRPDSYQAINIKGASGVQNLKEVLAWQAHPVVFGTSVDQAFMDLDDSSVWSFSGPSKGGHAMCIAGYDDAKGAFYVANSWGYGWGDYGYCWIAYSHFENGSNLSDTNGYYYIDSVDLDTGNYFGLNIPNLFPARNVRATDGTFTDKVQLTWDDVPGAVSYEIYRDTEDNKIADLPGSANSFDDTTLTDGFAHVYFVRSLAAPFEPQMSSGDIGYKAGDPDCQFVSPTSGAQGSLAVFNATVVGAAPISYAWDFGGGANPDTSTEPSPAVLLGAQGVYACTLTVSNANGQDVHNFNLVIDFPASVWTHTYGMNGDEQVNDVIVDGTSNTILIGETGSAGPSTDVMLMRYDPAGNVTLVRTWGGPNEDIGYGGGVDSAGNIYVAARTGSFGPGNFDCVLLKFQPDGDLEWTRTWGGAAGLDQPIDVGTDQDDNIYVAGRTMSYGQGSNDVLLLRYTPDGTLTDQRTWGTAGSESASGLSVSADGNKIYVCCNVPWGEGNGDVALLRYNHNLNRTWTRTIGSDQQEFAGRVSQDLDGNAFFLLDTEGGMLADRTWVAASYTPSGAQRWQQAASDTNGQDNFGTGITADAAGNVYVIQRYEDVISSHQWNILHKLDNFGNFVWSRQRDDEADWTFFNDVVASNTGKLHFGGRAFSANSYLWIDSNDVDTANPSLVEDKATTGTDGTPAGTVGNADAGVVATPSGTEDTGSNTSDEFLAILYNPNE